MREFDAATILWRTEQGDLAKDFRRAGAAALFDACFARAVAHEQEPAAATSGGRDHSPVADPAVRRVFGSRHGLLADAESREGLLRKRADAARAAAAVFSLSTWSAWTRSSSGRNTSPSLLRDAVLDMLDTQHFEEAEWQELLQAELLALPGWAGLMRRLEEEPSLLPHQAVPCSLMDYLAVRLTMSRVASRMGAAETVPEESPLKTQEKRRLSRAARVYDAARVCRLSANEVATPFRSRLGGLRTRSEVLQRTGAPPHPAPGI